MAHAITLTLNVEDSRLADFLSALSRFFSPASGAPVLRSPVPASPVSLPATTAAAPVSPVPLPVPPTAPKDGDGAAAVNYTEKDLLPPGLVPTAPAPVTAEPPATPKKGGRRKASPAPADAPSAAPAEVKAAVPDKAAPAQPETPTPAADAVEWDVPKDVGKPAPKPPAVAPKPAGEITYDALKAHAHRLIAAKRQQGWLAVLKNFNVTRIIDLAPDRYSELWDAITAAMSAAPAAKAA